MDDTKDVMNLTLSEEDRSILAKLEEELWIEDTRFDIPYVREIISDDFVEFGRSGRVFNKDEILSIPRQAVGAQVPLDDLKIHSIAVDVALLTYNSYDVVGGIEQHGRRSSLWVKADGKWRLRFHQGTPYCPKNQLSVQRNAVEAPQSPGTPPQA